MAQLPEKKSEDRPGTQPDRQISPNLSAKNYFNPNNESPSPLIPFFKQIEAANFVFTGPASGREGEYPFRMPAIVKFPFEAEDWLAVTRSHYCWQFERREPEEGVWRCIFVHSKESSPHSPREIFILTVVQPLDGVDSIAKSDQTGSTTLHAYQAGAPSSRDLIKLIGKHNGSAGAAPRSGTPLYPHS